MGFELLGLRCPRPSLLVSRGRARRELVWGLSSVAEHRAAASPKRGVAIRNVLFAITRIFDCFAEFATPPDSLFGGGGGVWFGLVWISACTKGGDPRPVCPYLTGSTGYPLGCLVSQPPRLLTIPVPRQGAGEREIPPCLYV